MQNQKKADPKKGHYRTSPLKNGLTKLPCFLKILVSWGDFFDNGLLLYPVQDHTMQSEPPGAAEFLQKRLISEFFGFQWQNLEEILSLF